MKNKGFTLIELVVVIVILGVLAATALPKFVNLGRDARIAAVNNLVGTLTEGARLGRTKCMLSNSTCSTSVIYSDLTGNKVTLNGVMYSYNFGWPVAWFDDDGTGVAIGTGGIAAWVDAKGFTKQPYKGDWFGVFTKDGAPDPTNCKVVYTYGWTEATATPVITPYTDGC